MSLLKALPRKALPLARTRMFTTSPFVSRSVVEGTTDALKAADRKLSDAAVKAIEKGEAATEAVKSTIGSTANQAEGSASKVSNQAEGSASKVSGDAKGKAHELKGKAHEVAGEAKGKASEVTGKVKGAAEEVTRKI